MSCATESKASSCRPGDVDAIAGAIEHFYQHPEVVAEMAVAARQRVVENFTWDHFRERLLDAYERAMANAIDIGMYE